MFLFQEGMEKKHVLDSKLAKFTIVEVFVQFLKRQEL